MGALSDREIELAIEALEDYSHQGVVFKQTLDDINSAIRKLRAEEIRRIRMEQANG